MSTQTIDEMLATLSPVTRAATILGMRAYDSIDDEHGRDYKGDAWQRTCKCGRSFSRGQGLGQHLAAVRRQADQAMAGEQDRVRMALRRVGAWVNFRNGDDSWSTSVSEGSTHDPKFVLGQNDVTLKQCFDRGWTIEGIG